MGGGNVGEPDKRNFSGATGFTEAGSKKKRKKDVKKNTCLLIKKRRITGFPQANGPEKFNKRKMS